MVFGLFRCRRVQEVKPQRLFVRFIFGQQPVSQQGPLGLSDAAFEDRFLGAHTIVGAGTRHAAEPPPSSGLRRRYIISYQDKHRTAFLTILTWAQAVDSPANPRVDDAPVCALV